MSAARLSRRDFLRGRVRAGLVAITPSRHGGSAATSASAPAPENARACIRAARCLANMSQVCTVCLERCGERGAIRFEGLHPIIDEARCTGCGDCARACPAPGGAIVLIGRRAVMRT